MTLLEALKHIRDNGPEYKEHGICLNLGALYFNPLDIDPSYEEEGQNLITRHYNSWPHFSGSVYYPVPDPSVSKADHILMSYAPAATKYIKSSKRGSLWSKHTRYGKLRWSLLNHLINEIEKEENNG